MEELEAEKWSHEFQLASWIPFHLMDFKRFLSPHPICTTFLSDGSHVPSLKMKTSQNIQLQKLMVPPSGIAAASSILGGGALKTSSAPKKSKSSVQGMSFFYLSNPHWRVNCLNSQLFPGVFEDNWTDVSLYMNLYIDLVDFYDQM